jgi:hypothetical protein
MGNNIVKPNLPNHSVSRRFPRRSRQASRGTAAVEMALIAPLFVILALGTAETSRLCDLQNELAVTVRQAARLAAMDREGVLLEGQSTNEKITADVRNMLTANGLPGDDVDVFIVDPVDHVTPFDLDASQNRMRLFELRLEMPYSAAGGLRVGGQELTLKAKIIFRNGRAVLVQ